MSLNWIPGCGKSGMLRIAALISWMVALLVVMGADVKRAAKF